MDCKFNNSKWCSWPLPLTEPCFFGDTEVETKLRGNTGSEIWGPAQRWGTRMLFTAAAMRNNMMTSGMTPHSRQGEEKRSATTVNHSSRNHHIHLELKCYFNRSRGAITNQDSVVSFWWFVRK